MKRKRFAIVLALCAALLVPQAVYAGEAVLPPDYMETNAEVEVIPVNGYIGRDTETIIPDEDGQSAVIYVELPVCVVFAAFESGGGLVSSPQYTITNLSEENDLRISLEGFAQTNAGTVPLNGGLRLDMLSHEGEALAAGVFPADYAEEKPLCERLPQKTEGSEDNQFGFKLGGSWSGGFAADIQPSFEMTLRFSIVE